jgi:hypothetical protein
MKPLSVLPIALFAILAGGCVTHDGRYDDRYHSGKIAGEPGQDRVLVCHKGKTMELPESALNGHMNHGDHRGPC